MKVVVNQPAPQPVPPTTYDLIGLTEEEVRVLRIALAVVGPAHYRVREGSIMARYTVVRALRETGVKYPWHGELR